MSEMCGRSDSRYLSKNKCETDEYVRLNIKWMRNRENEEKGEDQPDHRRCDLETVAVIFLSDRIRNVFSADL
ncbi:hypothetical protein Blut17040_11950 [Blautia luti]|nr:hypothetical protein Blut17040_11950 [Blautia luti]